MKDSNFEATPGAAITAVPDKQMIAEYGFQASRMMACDLTRFDAACEVDKYLREQGAPYYYRHRMSIILFGNVEGTGASRVPENSETSSTALVAHTEDSVKNILNLIDNFAESRHTQGHWTYNTKSQEARNAVIAVLQGE